MFYLKGMDLSTRVGPLTFSTPLLLASGTWGFGKELSAHLDLSRLGGLVTKGISFKPREGNPPPRLAETPCGLVNAIGLENPGLNTFRQEILPELREHGVPILVNIFGESLEDYLAVAEGLKEEEIVALEVNISCPNVEKGGLQFGQDPKAVRDLVEALARVSSQPIVVKLSPVGPVKEVAEAALSAGAVALTVANTYPALVVDIYQRRPALARGLGGLSGPAIKPLTLRLVRELYQAFKAPIIGCGGLSSAEDVVEYLLCGAAAVQIGTATLLDPQAPAKILEDLPSLLAKLGVQELKELIGALRA